MRIRLIEDILAKRKKVHEVAQQLGVTRKTIHKRKCRYMYYGIDGLSPRKPGPRTGVCWNKIENEVEDIIVEYARMYKLEGPLRLKMRLEDEQGIAVDQSTIRRILKRRHVRYHKEYEKPPSKKKLYVLDVPGREIQIDTSYPFGYQRKFVIYSAIDDCTRLVRTKAYDSATVANSIDFINWLRGKVLFKVCALRSDQGREFAKTFTERLTSLGIEHKMNAPYHPEHNGKVERYHRTMQSEELNQWPYLITIHEANYLLRQRTAYYNQSRRHTGLGMNGLTPKQKFKEISKNVTLILQ